MLVIVIAGVSPRPNVPGSPLVWGWLEAEQQPLPDWIETLPTDCSPLERRLCCSARRNLKNHKLLILRLMIVACCCCCCLCLWCGRCAWGRPDDERRLAQVALKRLSRFLPL